MARFLATFSLSDTRNGSAGEAAELRGMQRLRAAAHAAQSTLDVKRGDVATDRGLGGVEVSSTRS